MIEEWEPIYAKCDYLIHSKKGWSQVRGIFTLLVSVGLLAGLLIAIIFATICRVLLFRVQVAEKVTLVEVQEIQKIKR